MARKVTDLCGTVRRAPTKSSLVFEGGDGHGADRGWVMLSYRVNIQCAGSSNEGSRVPFSVFHRKGFTTDSKGGRIKFRPHLQGVSQVDPTGGHVNDTSLQRRHT